MSHTQALSGELRFNSACSLRIERRCRVLAMTVVELCSSTYRYLTSGHVVCRSGPPSRDLMVGWFCWRSDGVLSWEAIEAGCSCVTTHDTMKQTEVVAVRKFTSWQPTNCVWHLKHDITYACPDYTCREVLFFEVGFFANDDLTDHLPYTGTRYHKCEKTSASMSRGRIFDDLFNPRVWPGSQPNPIDRWGGGGRITPPRQRPNQ